MKKFITYAATLLLLTSAIAQNRPRTETVAPIASSGISPRLQNNIPLASSLKKENKSEFPGAVGTKPATPQIQLTCFQQQQINNAIPNSTNDDATNNCNCTEEKESDDNEDDDNDARDQSYAAIIFQLTDFDSSLQINSTKEFTESTSAFVFNADLKSWSVRAGYTGII